MLCCELQLHFRDVHALGAVELPPIPGSTSLRTSRPFEDHRYHMPRSTRPQDIPLPTIPNRVQMAFDALRTRMPRAVPSSGARRFEPHAVDATQHVWGSVHFDRDGSPETDVAFADLPSRHITNVLAAPPELEYPDDDEPLTYDGIGAPCAVQRETRADPGDMGSWLSRPRRELAPREPGYWLDGGAGLHRIAPTRVAGYTSFSRQFQEAMRKGLIDGLGELPTPTRSNTPK